MCLCVGAEAMYVQQWSDVTIFWLRNLWDLAINIVLFYVFG